MAGQRGEKGREERGARPYKGVHNQGLFTMSKKLPQDISGGLFRLQAGAVGAD